MVQTGYAKDGVPIVDYPVNPNLYGTSTARRPTPPSTAVWSARVQGLAAGRRPTGPYSGSALTNITNDDSGGGAGSTAYRLWCATDSTRITDWGSLTNLGPNVWSPMPRRRRAPRRSVPSGTEPSSVVGQTISGTGIPSGTTVSSVGTTLDHPVEHGHGERHEQPDGDLRVEAGGRVKVVRLAFPIRIVGVNTASGTEATFASFAESGVSGGGCSSNMNTNAASDPNSATDTGDNATPHIALENNSDQLDQFARGDFPNPDYVDQAIEVATSLYIESNGVYNTNPYAAASTIDGTSYTSVKLSENGTGAGTASELNNSYPTARTLFNIYTGQHRAGIDRWILELDL